MSLVLQIAAAELIEARQMPKRSRKRDLELAMTRAKSPQGKKLKSPPAKRKATDTAVPKSQVVKKLKSPPAKRKPTDTAPLKIEEGEPSPALKKLLIKHMIGKVVFKKK